MSQDVVKTCKFCGEEMYFDPFFSALALWPCASLNQNNKKYLQLAPNGRKNERAPKLRNEGLETHIKNARAVPIVPGIAEEIDVIKDALTKYMEENKIASEISNIEKLENEGYVINVRVKDLDQYAGSGSLYNKLYDIVLEKGSQATIVLNLESL